MRVMNDTILCIESMRLIDSAIFQPLIIDSHSSLIGLENLIENYSLSKRRTELSWLNSCTYRSEFYSFQPIPYQTICSLLFHAYKSSKEDRGNYAGFLRLILLQTRENVGYLFYLDSELNTHRIKANL